MSKAASPAGPQLADSHDLIRVHGARVNNLKDVSIEIPKRRLTVFTGVSGSGKSSLVFGTIAAESQRLINETYSAFVQGFMPTLARPEVDVLEGLTTAIIVDQQRMGADPRSTVGTATDANALLRILFSRLGQPHIGSPQAFSFNVPSISGAGAVTLERGGQTVKERRSFSITGGMCPRCEGRGAVTDLDLTQLYDETKSLNEGALTVPGYAGGGWNSRLYSESGFVDPDKPIAQVHQEGTARLPPPRAGPDEDRRDQHDLRGPDPADPEVDAVQGPGGHAAAHPGVRRPRGHLHHLSRLRRHPAGRSGPVVDDQRDQHRRRLRHADQRPGRVGARPATSRRSRRCSTRWPAPWTRSPRSASATCRSTGPPGTLSGGEAQRVKMVRQLGSALTDVTYVFDEPTIGLHPHDVQRMNDLLLRLRDKGNTVLVVEHKPETIADRRPRRRPRPRRGRGRRHRLLRGHRRAAAGQRHHHRPPPGRPGHAQGHGAAAIRGAGDPRRDTHNLQDVDVDIPLGVLVVITGVAGVGQELAGPRVDPGRARTWSSIDQGAIRGSRRSNPATYTGLLDPIRTAFAKANGVKPALFSANSEGACPTCNGAGVIYTDLGMMAGVAIPCERLRGQAVRRRRCWTTTSAAATSARCWPCRWPRPGSSSADGEARTPAAHAILGPAGRRRARLPEPSASRSPRCPAASGSGSSWPPTWATRAASYILDEPTAGLHLADVEQLLGLLDRLVDAGKSVIVIEHHQAVMAHADWIIDLGPGAGHDGGRVVFKGTPADLVAARCTLTGEHLAAYVGK